MSAKIGRNEPCPCGSGEKFKRCCKDVETVAKLKAYNEKLYEVMVNQAREEDPVSFEHRQRYLAYHESGHALMEMLLYKNLKHVTIVPHLDSVEEVEKGLEQIEKGRDWGVSNGRTVGIHPYPDCDHYFEQIAIILAGKPAGDLFCECEKHVDCDADDRRDATTLIAAIKPEFKPEHKQKLVSGTTAVIQRHRVQLDAIANALIERETLSGDEVMDVMLASGWNPETDCDPERFYNEALRITAEGARADASLSAATRERQLEGFRSSRTEVARAQPQRKCGRREVIL